jgi:hypothetical protein
LWLGTVRMIRPAVALSLLALAACGGGRGPRISVPIPVSTVAESKTISNAFAIRAGQLTDAQLDSVAGRIRGLRATPAELQVDEGDTIRVADDVRVIALDSAGAELGELPFYNYAFTGRGFRLLADGRVVLSRRGTVTLTVRLPARLIRGGGSKQASASVALVVGAGR